VNTVGRTAKELTDAAVAWLQEVPPEQPIHMLINYFDPHAPYNPPDGFSDPPCSPPPDRFNEVFINAGTVLPDDQRERYLRCYDGEIRFMDDQLGRFLDALRELGRYDAAIIAIVADHGELFAEHGFMGHGRWLYEPIVRVPLAVRLPFGKDSSRVVEATVSVVDLLPLVASEVGLELPPGVEGLAVGAREIALAETRRDGFSLRVYGSRFDRDLFAVIRWPWKLIQSSNGEVELFRLDVEPESESLGGGSEIEEDLRQALEAGRKALSAAKHLVPPTEVDPELRRRLRELGYVD
jgi:arylsulfatase A-like enzyme